MIFLKELFSHFFDSNTFQKGAALAFYAVFSLLPMIMIITAVLGLVFGSQAVSGEIYAELKEILGQDAALQIQNLIKNQHLNHNGFLGAIIGFVTLALSASGMFSQIHNSFNSVWNIKAKPKSSLLKYIYLHLSSFLLLIGLFFIIFISTLSNTILLKYAHALHIGHLYIFEHILSLMVLSVVFALMFRFLGDAKIYWKALIYGGVFTAVFFTIGKIGIGIYIAHSHVTTTFGSASVLALLLLWVYYTSQIIFLGASFVKAISDAMGYKITPASQAISIEKVELDHRKLGNSKEN